MTEFQGNKGKFFFGSVKVGNRGQIVIPLNARNLFGIKPKDNIYIFGDPNRGLGLTSKIKIDEKYLKKHKQYLGVAKVGERGQIVIPQNARELFNIKPGDYLLVFGDIKKGLGIIRANKLKNFAIKLFNAFRGFQNMQNKNGSDFSEE
ncbi:MAG: AbrB/MazE/SpoVT family DNA-binding domain-containing protein [Promethearchaeia archaeon]